WHDASVQPGGTTASGGTSYADKGFPPLGMGSGAWVGFADGSSVHVRVGISYVSLANARANLKAEIPAGTTLAQIRQRARDRWDKALGGIAIEGGSVDQRSTIYTALYHVLMHPNAYSDVNGEYRGFDQQTHRLASGQHAQYANFSGWDIYRSHLQLVTWLQPQ